MGQPVAHFEITGTDPEQLRSYYHALFGWDFDTSGTVSDAISEPTDYGFVDPATSTNGQGIPGGVGGGPSFKPQVIFYVGVPDVEAALQQAEELGGTRRMGPLQTPNPDLVIGHFSDPEGNVIGVAGPR